MSHLEVFFFTYRKIPYISNLKKPSCASKRDMLELSTLLYVQYWWQNSWKELTLNTQSYLSSCICQITHYCVILAQLKYKAASCSQWHAWPSAEGRGPEPQKGKEGSNRNFVFVETLISLSFNTPMSDFKFRYLFSCPCHSRVKEET